MTGPSVLDVSTIRGKIAVTAGEPGQIVVIGTATVRVDWSVPANAEALPRHVADNPPIQLELTLGNQNSNANRRARPVTNGSAGIADGVTIVTAPPR